MSVPQSCPIDACSDLSIEATMRGEFRRSGYAALHDIEFRYADGLLAMIGSVPSFYLKQLAIALVRRRRADLSIDDRLQVVSDGRTQSVSGGAGLRDAANLGPRVFGRTTTHDHRPNRRIEHSAR